MAKIENRFLDLGHLDSLAELDSPVHRLDSRVKVVTTLVFVVLVVSRGSHEVAGLLPFVLFPAVAIAASGLSLGYFLRKLLIVSPFVFCVAVFNPILDRSPMLQLGPLVVSGGWVSFVSILLRFTLTVGAALVLIATTGFAQVCRALEQLGLPKLFVVQLLFLYRYLFVLGDEGTRMVRSHALRSGGHRMSLAVFRQLAGTLLLRTIARAERIHLAMLCRGFDGEIRSLRPGRFGGAEMAITAGLCGLLLLFRLVNLPQAAGTFLLEILP